jgi:hypothetical protein
MNAIPLRMKILLALALAHLGLVALGASYVGYAWLGPLAPAAGFYAGLSGAGSTYGFFAPGVGSQLAATFDIIDARGRSREVRLLSGKGGEGDLRLGNIIDQFWNETEDPVALQRSLSSSLAGTIFGRYPEARQVAVHLKKFDPVSMQEFREGKRPEWTTVYNAKFVKNAEQGGAR